MTVPVWHGKKGTDCSVPCAKIVASLKDAEWTERSVPLFLTNIIVPAWRALPVIESKERSFL
jgi:hypothetical protein